MKLSSAIKAFGSLCLLLADGFPVSEGEAPRIMGPRRVQVKARPGDELFLRCRAFVNGDAELTVIYWLIDGSFPEDAASSDRIVESEETATEDGAILQKSLVFKNVTSEDLKSTFTCVVTNAVGTARKQATLAAPSGDCKVRRNRRH